VKRRKQRRRKLKKKKAKKGGAPDEYQSNVNKCVDKAHEGKTLSEIIKLPPSALQGLAPKADASFAEYNIKTIKDLANWKYFAVAAAIAELAKVEVKGQRVEDSKLNINRILDKKYEKYAFKDLLKQPLSAFSGLTEKIDEHFGKDVGVNLKTIGDLSKYKFCRWAQALVALADYENADQSS